MARPFSTLISPPALLRSFLLLVDSPSSLWQCPCAFPHLLINNLSFHVLHPGQVVYLFSADRLVSEFANNLLQGDLVCFDQARGIKHSQCQETADENKVVFPGDGLERLGCDLTHPD